MLVRYSKIGYWLLLMVYSQQVVTAQSAKFTKQFQLIDLPDTMHIEIDQYATRTDTIPSEEFFKQIPQRLLHDIDHIADPETAVVLGKEYFKLDDSTFVYWVEIHQSWFQNHSLFIYNSEQNKFTDRITVAELYGGDGGLSLFGSWIFDFDGDKKPDIVRQHVEYYVIPKEDDVETVQEKSAELLLWRNGHFELQANSNEQDLIKRFPVKSFWD